MGRSWLRTDDESGTRSERVIELTEAATTVTFVGVAEQPVPSLLRGFSAPVRLAVDLGDDDLLFLLRHDDDLRNRWEAMQKIQSRAILQLMDAGAEGGPLSPSLIRPAGSCSTTTGQIRHGARWRCGCRPLPGSRTRCRY